MMRHAATRTSLAALLALTISPLFAQQAVESLFSEAERQVIERYYGKAREYLPEKTAFTEEERGKGKHGKEKHGKEGREKHGKGSSGGLPPGLARKGQLPPGLAKREVLPPGLERRPLPRDLESQLPPVPPGTERVMVDQAVVLVDKVSNRVLDILTGR